MPTKTNIPVPVDTSTSTSTSTAVVPTATSTATMISKPDLTSTATPTATPTTESIATPRPGINVGLSILMDTTIRPGLRIPTVILFDNFSFSSGSDDTRFIVMRLTRFVFSNSSYQWFNVPNSVSAASISQEERIPCTAESQQCALDLDDLSDEQQTNILDNGISLELDVADDLNDNEAISLDVALADENLQPVTSNEDTQTETTVNVTVGAEVSTLTADVIIIPPIPTTLEVMEEPSQRWALFLPFIER